LLRIRNGDSIHDTPAGKVTGFPHFSNPLMEAPLADANTGVKQ